jgi:hypothetical protein
MDLVYHIQLRGGPTLLLRPMESSSSELKALLSAYYGKGECIGIQYQDTAYTLSAVAARPDSIYSLDNLRPIFAVTSSNSNSSGSSSSSNSNNIPVDRDDADIFIRELGQIGLLSSREVQTLIPLKDSEFVKAALEVYDVEKDLDDLVDTLQRIVAIRSPPQRSIQQQQQPTTSTSTSTRSDPIIKKLQSTTLHLREFPTDQVEEIIITLSHDYNPPSLNREEALVLAGLVPKQHPLLQAAYEGFNISGDVGTLSEHLKAVARHFGLSQAITDSYQRALILDAFEVGEPRIWGAWDVYVDEHDILDFADTLARCLKRMAPPPSTKASNQQSSSKPNTNSTSTAVGTYKHGAAGTDEKTVARRLVINLHSNNRINDENGAKLMAMVDAGAIRVIDAAAEWLSSKKTDEDAERFASKMLSLIETPTTSSRSSGGDSRRRRGNKKNQPQDWTSDDVVDEALVDEIYSFVAHLVDKDMLTENEGLQLENLIGNRDVRILAAFDAYGADTNLNELVDSLQRIALLAVQDEDNSSNLPNNNKQQQQQQNANDDDDEENADDEQEEMEMVQGKDDGYISSGEDEILDFGKTLYDEMFNDLELNRQQLQALKAGYLAKDPLVYGPLDEFVQTQNIEKLKEDLKIAAKRLADGPLLAAAAEAAQGNNNNSTSTKQQEEQQTGSSNNKKHDPLEEMIEEGLITKAQASKIPPALLKEAKTYYDMTGDELSFHETILRIV